ncbi:MAG: MerR family transcriptional regulator [Tannerella sp.]|jgi:DNA-binding transcriptional MerR regulator|nr:MerR family transcriptional regulator [Tannerella sp.]
MEDSPASKVYHSIKHVASILEESESTLRHWEKEFPDKISPRRKGRNVRVYSEKDIENLRSIKYLLRDCNLSHEGARKQLKTNNKKVTRQAQIVENLKQIKAELEALEKTLDEVGKMMPKRS